MTTPRSRCFTVTRFIKPPIKYIFSDSLIIADSDYYLIQYQTEVTTSGPDVEYD